MRLWNLELNQHTSIFDDDDKSMEPKVSEGKDEKLVVDTSLWHLEHNETMTLIKAHQESRSNLNSINKVNKPPKIKNNASSTCVSEIPSNGPFEWETKPIPKKKINSKVETKEFPTNLFQCVITPDQEIPRKDSFELHENYSDLLEIMQKGVQKERRSFFYEIPIYKRQNVELVKDNEPVYYCLGCRSVGAAVDFFAPTLCSMECLRRLNEDSSPKQKISQKKVALLNSDSSLKMFNWGDYLDDTKSEAAPIRLFSNPYPRGPNYFQYGMKVEAIDPQNQSMVCVCTVVQVLGYRIKLHFDNNNSIHDFWVNADSPNIFPPGWCATTKRTLHPPKKYQFVHAFRWKKYMEQTQGILPYDRSFPHLKASYGTNNFKIGMKLEAVDINNKLSVASVADVMKNRILIHFDGRSNSYDYWVEIDSPNIHPINFHKESGDKQILEPPVWGKPFFWSYYLIDTCCEAADKSLFSPRKPVGFATGMKLEVVDIKNPTLIRPATILDVKGCRIKVRFDSWLPDYCFWVEDNSPDIHPIRWAENTGHPLEPPISKFQRTI